MNNYDRDPKANAEVARLWREFSALRKRGEKSADDDYYTDRENLRGELRTAAQSSHLWACISGKNVLRMMAMLSSLRPEEPHRTMTRVSMVVDEHENLKAK